MNLDPKDFPVLCYVLSHHLNSSSLSPEFEQSLLTQFPYLNHPKFLLSLAQSVPKSITQTQSLIGSLGPRPDPSSVAIARAKIAEIQSTLQKNLLELESAEKEMQIYTAVVRLEEIHQDLEKQLRDVEESLVRVYGSVVEELKKEMEFEMNEDVVRVLKDAENGVMMERVELSGRQIRFFVEDFGKFRNVVVLNLSKNQLEVIPDSIAGLQKLEELDVSSILLVSLPDSIGLLINLRVLNVSGNKLNALPETIARCSSLMELDASFNNLMSFPTNIGYGLINLVKLSVQLNKIRYLPASICEMRSLRYLDAHFNELCGLPSSFGRLTNLEVLNLSSNFNDLTVLPESFGDLSNLRELDLSNNQIRALPDTFGRLENLTELNLDQNPLVVPPLDVVKKGVEAVKEFMAKRWVDMIAEEQERNALEANKRRAAPSGWLAWGSSMLNNLVSGVSQTVSGYQGAGKSYRDPWLDQQL